MEHAPEYFARVGGKPAKSQRPQHRADAKSWNFYADDALTIFGANSDDLQFRFGFGLEFLPQRNDGAGDNMNLLGFDFRHHRILFGPPRLCRARSNRAIPLVYLLLADVGHAGTGGLPYRIGCERFAVRWVRVVTGLEHHNEVALLPMLQECSIVGQPHLIGP